MIIIRNTVYIIVAGILWGIISIFVTQLQSVGLSSMEIVALRVFFSAVLLTVYILVNSPPPTLVKLAKRLGLRKKIGI